MQELAAASRLGEPWQYCDLSSTGIPSTLFKVEVHLHSTYRSPVLPFNSDPSGVKKKKHFAVEDTSKRWVEFLVFPSKRSIEGVKRNWPH